MATSNFRFLVYFKSQPQTIIVLILIFEMCRKAYEACAQITHCEFMDEFVRHFSLLVSARGGGYHIGC